MVIWQSIARTPFMFGLQIYLALGGGVGHNPSLDGKKHAPSRQFTPLTNLKLALRRRNFSAHQILSDSKRLAFAGLRAPSLTSRSTRQIDPSVDVSTRKKNLNFNRKGRALIERVVFEHRKYGMIIS